MVSTQADTPAIRLSKVDFAWGYLVNDFSIKIEDFRLEKTERALLVGPSGTGKSTFLSLICGILQPMEEV